MSEKYIFKGGVFSQSIDGGRAPVVIELQSQRLYARAKNGAAFEIPYDRCQLERGGSSGKMIFCRNEDRSLTIFCEDAEFLPALEFHSGGALGEQLAVLREAASRKRRQHLFWTALVLFALTGIIAGGYYAIRAGATAAAHALPISVDEKIGEIAIKSMALEGETVRDPVIIEAVQKIVDRLAPHATRKGFKFTVQVVRSPVANAFALPGGQIVVYTGLIENAESPEQLAGVLAHEMAHVECRHGTQRMAQSMGIGMALSLVLGDDAGFVGHAADLAQNTTLNAYSREHETEADIAGVHTMHAAGLDPAAMARFFQVMEDRHGDLPRGLGWLSTHPHHQGRIADINQAIADLPARAYTPLEVNWNELKTRLAQANGKQGNGKQAVEK